MDMTFRTVRFFLTAKIFPASVTLFYMRVLFLAAVCLAGKRHGWQDQRIGRAEHDDRCQSTHQPSADMAVSFHHQIS
ncbi:hypothetical protein, partial [Faecalibaculum rodentium]|uniref:hypothetical protein n=1 Tax=Faecalibaculum rodentium TaxID=1702221 RepID=UPI0026ED0B4D